MPLLNVEIVLRPDESLQAQWAQSIADAAGEIFGTPAGQTWVKLIPVAPEHYAENGIADLDIAPVFVSIVKGRLPERTALEKEVGQLTDHIAKICNRPSENVHIIFEQEGIGRVAFGGKLVS